MLKQRIREMNRDGIIGNDAAAFADGVIDMLEADYPEIGPERAAVFICHLAMTAERVRRGELMERMDDELWQEVTRDTLFPAALALWDKVTRLGGGEFPENENKFSMLHICGMLR